MENKLTPLEAWADFYKFIKKTENWKGLSVTHRDQIGKANRAASLGKLGNDRIKNLILKCAGGRYKIVESLVFYLNE